ncbi:NlpC/P60 family protein [Aestuariivirga litoralis]|uniref:C40 family peptidase n=1 Tax=Aestuariivirga litoralis TaxID=2650924 RepID=UPI0018C4B095|nr:NlpC/P60 family protein [Aestuariivirga litoralis]MBG1232775.1 NlpC/P60 family protein [Aestuariivirga litoralis]
MVDARRHVDEDILAKGEKRQFTVPIAPVLKRPEADSRQETQALMGELCTLLDIRGAYSWIQLSRDGYVGFVETAALTADIVETTHRVTVPSTLLYPWPDLKSHPVRFLPMNAEFKVIGAEGDFVGLATGGFVFAGHLAAKSVKEKDFVAVAQQMLHTPYYWGGKSVHGLDCSGLVQVSLQATGVVAPRDADMQEHELGVLVNDHRNLQRGDLVFWKGHVGIMQDAKTLLHANGHWMKTVSEPLADAIARTPTPVTAIKRLSL